eukprot:scaffold2808_cov421-Prasinococcus_capsulatus_cf.AAC.8
MAMPVTTAKPAGGTQLHTHSIPSRQRLPASEGDGSRSTAAPPTRAPLAPVASDAAAPRGGRTIPSLQFQHHADGRASAAQCIGALHLSAQSPAWRSPSRAARGDLNSEL